MFQDQYRSLQMTWPGADDLTLSPAHYHWDVKKKKKKNLLFLLLFFVLLELKKKFGSEKKF